MMAKGILLLFLLVVLYALIANAFIVYSTKPDVFADIGRIPVREVGVLLGTSSRGHTNQNPYFTSRINAAAKLFHAGKIKRILISGNGCQRNFHEDTEMQAALLKLGVPKDKMELDPRSLRTFDTVYRVKHIYHLNDVTFISQRYHDYRALFLAKSLGVKAIAFAAKPVGGFHPWHGHLREYLARALALADVSLLRRKPKYLH